MYYTLTLNYILNKIQYNIFDKAIYMSGLFCTYNRPYIPDIIEF